MTDQQLELVSLYVKYQEKYLKENPILKGKFIKILNDSPEDLFQECKNNIPRIMQVIPPDFRNSFKLSCENNPEGFCRDIINECKKVFLK